MKTMSTLLFGLFVFLLNTESRAQGEDGFVPLDPATLETISGKVLMLTSYGVIMGLLLLFALHLFLRDRLTTREIIELKKRLKPRDS